MSNAVQIPKHRKTLKIIELEENQEVDFKWTENGSKTMVLICPLIRRSMIREVHIHILDSENKDIMYIMKNRKPGWNGVDFNELGIIEGNKMRIEFPSLWQTFFCKDHKTHSFRLYVPKESKKVFFFTGLGSFQIDWK